ncbi:MBL fold metallo-hydrolase [Pararhizobium sp. O133]|uniref:MBL fold metallo-hydrolase n=1 Tax=Pararhizobium sp. O133 TaxID=3449278 RepID=UPI003F685E32
MNDKLFRVRLWGVRGSLPVSGAEFQHYGGNTICIEMQCGSHRLLFDAGSGLMPAGQTLKSEGVSDFNLFFTHCHYDHIVGLPYLPSLFDPMASVTIWSGHLAGRMSTRQMIGEFMRPPWFPVEPDICRASINCRDFRSGDVLVPHDNVAVKTGSLNHPGGAIGYRVEWGGRAVALVTDTEHRPGSLDPAVLDLIEGTDLFLYDCMYTDDEMHRHVGYGHSSWQQAIRLAKAAGAKQVAFIHHSPLRTDSELDAIQRLAAQEFNGAFTARDGQVIDV